MNCHLCGAGASVVVEHYQDLPRVTSDCKPWPAGGQLHLCLRCGTLQKSPDAVWLDEMQRIYDSYTIYHLSGGEEQPCYQAHTGQLKSRSACLFDHLVGEVSLPEHGRLLDVGCGNGGLLRTFSQHRPHWTLAGTEFNDKYRSLVESIPGVEQLYTGALSDVPGQFDAATMVHVLEHIPWPSQTLDQLRERLVDGGMLVVVLPDSHLNPFDLVIADHCTHFDEASVRGLLLRHGFEPFLITTEWIRKERVVLARKVRTTIERYEFSAPETLSRAADSIAFLRQLLQSARHLREQSVFGLFGTSIGATWLYGALSGAVDFWVDEDPSRVGRDYLAKPVLAPHQVPAGSHVLLALAPVLAGMLQAKFSLTLPDVHWCAPA